MNERENIGLLLGNIKRGLDFYSVSELNEAILEAIDKKDNKAIKINMVIDSVCDVFKYSKRLLLNSKFRGSNKLPSHVLIVYLVRELDITTRHIANKVFNMNPNSHSAVFKISKSYDNLNPKIKSDAEFMDYYAKVKSLINGKV